MQGLSAAGKSNTQDQEEAFGRVIISFFESLPVRSCHFQSGKNTTLRREYILPFCPPYPVDGVLPSVRVWARVSPSVANLVVVPPASYQVLHTRIMLTVPKDMQYYAVYWIAHIKPPFNVHVSSIVDKITAMPPSSEINSPSNKALVAEITQLSRKSPLIQDFDSSGQTLLHAASTAGNLALAKWLLNNGAKVNATDYSSRTPVLCALSAGHLPVARYLIQSGADLTMQTDFGTSALIYLCRMRPETNEDEFKVVFSSIVAVNDRVVVEQNASGETPLFVAVKSKNLIAIRLLLAFDLVQRTINTTGPDGFGLLFHALRGKCDTSIIQLLLQAGADPNDVQGGNNCVDWAISFGTPEPIVRLLSTHLMTFPQDVVIQILSMLLPKDLYRVQRVCKALMKLSKQILLSKAYWESISASKEAFEYYHSPTMGYSQLHSDVGAALVAPPVHIPKTNSMAFEYDCIFKIVILGGAGVGKSCLLLRFADGEFTDSYIPTIGVDFKIKTVDICGLTIKMQIWETAGQERFRTITPHSYTVPGVIIVFDLTEASSFSAVEQFFQEAIRADPKVILIVGNKRDKTAARLVSCSQVHDFLHSRTIAEHHDPTKRIVDYIETSAKTNENVDLAFFRMAQLLGEDFLSRQILPTSPGAIRTTATRRGAYSVEKPSNCLIT
ncbi:GTP binding protein [Pelomyxa schiedti]|nr:GTP binding protein [Pelomyxa schiedti]